MVNRYNSFRGMQRMGCDRDERHPSCGENCHAQQNIDRRSDSYGCTGDCKALLTRLQKIDFSLVDVALYLDTHPECNEALSLYNKLLSERESIRKTLSHKCKRPMSAFENSGESWDWISSPWPWEASAN